MDRNTGLGLLGIVASRLSEEEKALLTGQLPLSDPQAYDEAIARVKRRLHALEVEAQRNEERVQDRYLTLPDLPAGRQATILGNNSCSFLLALAYGLMRQSFAERFNGAERSLKLAETAKLAADRACRMRCLSPEGLADLQAEALMHLGNAHRLSSDLRAAETALLEAESQLELGTRDRNLAADYLSRRGSLFVDQGRFDAAADLFAREITLRRLLGDSEQLGAALINRGVIAAWAEPVGSACDYLREGAVLVKDRRLMILALYPLGEVLARDGDGLYAWKVVCTLETCLVLAGADGLYPDIEATFRMRHSWLRGITFRALGELGAAAEELRAVHEELNEAGPMALEGAVLSLDLAAVYAAQGEFAAVRREAENAHTVLAAQGVEGEAMGAFLTFYAAVQREAVPEALALQVANFLARYQHNRNLRFEAPL